jgi:hypothetical protein
MQRAKRACSCGARIFFQLTVPRNNHVRRTSSNTAVLACSTLRMRVLAWCTHGKKHVIRNNTAAPALMRRFGPRAAVNGVEAARGTRRKRRQLSKRGAFWIKHCLAWVKGIEPTSYDEVAFFGPRSLRARAPVGAGGNPRGGCFHWTRHKPP